MRAHQKPGPDADAFSLLDEMSATLVAGGGDTGLSVARRPQKGHVQAAMRNKLKERRNPGSQCA